MARESGEVRVFGDLLQHYQTLTIHLEGKANWLISISIAIFVFIASNFQKMAINQLSWFGTMIILIGCAISMTSFITVLVPRIKGKMKYHDSKSLFSHRSLSKNYNEDELAAQLKKLRMDHNKMDDSYSGAIYRLASDRLPFISKRLKVGGWSLIISLIIGGFLIILGFN